MSEQVKKDGLTVQNMSLRDYFAGQAIVGMRLTVANYEHAGDRIDSINFSLRARNAIEQLHISTLGELAGKTEKELMFLKNCGMSTVLEIKEKLEAFGLRVGMADLRPAHVEAAQAAYRIADSLLSARQAQ